MKKFYGFTFGNHKNKAGKNKRGHKLMAAHLDVDADFTPFYNFGLHGRILYYTTGSVFGRKLAIIALCLMFMSITSASSVLARAVNPGGTAGIGGAGFSSAMMFGAYHYSMEIVEDEAEVFSGQVLNSSGFGVGEISVLLHKEGFSVDQTTTDANGFFTLTYEPDPVSTPGATDLPTELELSSAWPNPFKESTRLNVAIPEDRNYTVEVYDITGRRVAMMQRNLNAGHHQVQFNGRLAAGVYLVRVTGDGNSVVRKITSVGHTGLTVPIQMNIEGSAENIADREANVISLAAESAFMITTQETDWYEESSISPQQGAFDQIELVLTDKMKSSTLRGKLENQFGEPLDTVNVHLTYRDILEVASKSNVEGLFETEFEFPVRLTDSLATAVFIRQNIETRNIETTLLAEISLDKTLIQQKFDALVHGHVTDESGQALEGVEITLSNDAGFLDQKLSQQDGSFQLMWESSEGSDYTLYLEAGKSGYFSFFDTLDYAVSQRVDFLLSPALASISGNITDLEGFALSDVEVTLRHPDETILGTTTTAENGAYNIQFASSENADHDLILSVEKSGYFSEIDTLAFTFTATQNFEMEPSVAQFSGVISVAGGDGLENASVIFRNPENEVLAEAETAENGAYSLSWNRTRGENFAISAEAGKDGYFTKTEALDYAISGSWNAELEAVQAGISGVITSTEGAALSGVAVTLRHPDETVLGITTTTENGAYNIQFASSENADHDLILSAEKSGYFHETETLPFALSATKNFEMEPSVAQFSGVIRVAGGDGLENASVIFRNPENDVLAEVQTAENGDYTLNWTRERGENFAISAEAGKDGYFTKSETLDYAISGTWNAELEIVQAGISGVITSTEGGALSGVEVTLRHPDETVLGTTTTTGNGAYNIQFASSEDADHDLILSAEKSGYFDETETLPFALSATKNFEMEPSVAQFSGVISAAGGDGLENASVIFRNPENEVLAETQTAENGAYTLNWNRERGENFAISAEASKDGFFTKTETLDYAISGSWNAELEAVQVGISGVITSTEGGALSGVEVTLRHPDETVLGTATTAENGAYNIQFASSEDADHDLILTAEKSGYFDETETLPFALSVTKNLEMEPSVAQFSGVISAAGGDGLENASVIFRNPENEVLAEVQTAENGDYTLNWTRERGENFAISAEAGKDGYFTKTETLDYAISGSWNAELEIVQVGISGVITSTEGGALSGVTVTLTHPDETVLGTATTTENGAYNIQFASSEDADHDLILTAEKSGYFSETETLPFSLSATKNLEMEPSVAQFSGVISAAGGDGLENASVIFRNPENEVLAETQTAENGAYTINWTRERGENFAISAEASKDGFFTKTETLDYAISGIWNAELEIVQVGITGVITSIEGGALSGVEVTLRHPDETVLGTATSAENGAYSIQFASTEDADHDLILSAEKSGYFDETETLPFAFSVTKNFEMEPSVAQFSGVISVAGGDGLENASVIFRNPENDVLTETETAENGAYTLNWNRERGENFAISAEASKDGYFTKTETLDYAISGTWNEELEAVQVSVSGMITTIEGGALSGVEVTLRHPDETILGTTTTAENGAYTIQFASSEDADHDLILSAVKSGYFDETETLPFALSATKNFEMEPSVAQFSGVISAVGDDGLENASVIFRNPENDVLAETQTAENGAYSLNWNRERGENFAISAEAGKDGYFTKTETLDYAISGTWNAELEAVQVGISGVITSTGGGALSGVAVTLRQPDETVLGTATTGENGAYNIQFASTENADHDLILSVEKSGYFSETETLPFAFSVTKNLQMEPSVAQFSGVISVAGGDGLENASVIFRNSENEVLAETQTAENGAYSLSWNRERGENFAISAEGSKDGFFTKTETLDYAISGTWNAELEIVQVSVSGVITSMEGGALSGVEVTLRHPDETVLGTATTAENGAYTIQFASTENADHDLMLSAEKSGYFSESETLPFAFSTSKNLEMEPLMAAFSGVVRNVEELGLENVAVQFRTPEDILLAETTTDENGNYELGWERERGEDFELHISLSALFYEDKSTGISYSTSAEKNFTLAMRQYSISGWLENTAEERIAGAGVSIIHNAEETLHTATSTAEGTFTLNYTLAQLSNPDTTALRIAVPAMEWYQAKEESILPHQTAMNLILEDVMASYTISGTVANEDEEAVSGLNISLLRGETHIGDAESSGLGAFEIPVTTAKRFLEEPAAVRVAETDWYKAREILITQETQSLNITLEDKLEDISIQGSITNQRNQAVSEVSIQNEYENTTSSSEGTYQISTQIPKRNISPEAQTTINFTKDGYNTKNVSVALQSQNKDINLERILRENSFVIRPFDLNMESISVDLELSVPSIEDPEVTQTYTFQTEDGQVNIQWSGWPEDDTAVITHNHPDYSKTMIGRRHNQDPLLRNLYQNIRPSDPAELNVPQMNEEAAVKSNLYLIPKFVEYRARTSEETVTTDFEYVLNETVIARFPTYNVTWHTPSLDFAVLKWQQDNESFVTTEEKFDEMYDVAREIFDGSFKDLPNGDNIRPYTIHRLESPDDPIYQDFLNRPNDAKDVAFTWRKIMGTAGNSSILKQVDGTYYINTANSHYTNGAIRSAIIEEIFESITRSDEPSDNNRYYITRIVNPDSPDSFYFNDIGKKMFRAITLSDPEVLFRDEQ